MIRRLSYCYDVITKDLPPHQADAGHARSLAMATAAWHAGPPGILLTTDADSIVPQDWVGSNLDALHQGADHVCGRAIIDPVEVVMIPEHLHADDALGRHLMA
jgi:hypothetical protein